MQRVVKLIAPSTLTIALFATTLGGIAAAGASGAPAARQSSEFVPGSGPRWPAQTQRAGAWAIEAKGRQRRVVWHGRQRLGVGDARIEIRSSGRHIGYAREVGNDAVFDAPSAPDRAVSNPSTLTLWRSGQRLDGPNGQLLRPSRSPHNREGSHVDRISQPVQARFDPGKRGPYRVRRTDYALDGLKWFEYAAPIEVVGEVTEPVGAQGPLPFVLILHGRHSTCFIGGANGDSTGEWPCPVGWSPIPSHEGYRMMAELLASQGKIVVSIAANGINGQDYVSDDGGAAARSALIRHHLDLWAKWSRDGGDPWRGRFAHRVDLSNVVLVGHSRGGEGVARAAIDATASDPYRIRGLELIAPTAFGQQVPTNVHTVVLLPFCDGDVSDLQGQIYVDGGRDLADHDPALRSAVMILGANHNFFNREWTPGLSQAPSFDDFGYANAQCGPASPKRLDPRVQQAVGASYAAALVRLVDEHDTGMRQILDEGRSMPSARGARVLVSAIGSNRALVYAANRVGATHTSGELNGEMCLGYSPDEVGCSTLIGSQGARTPHWLAPYPAVDHPAPRALALHWRGRGVVTFDTPHQRDLRSATRIDARIAIDPKLRGQVFDAWIIDDDGHVAKLSTNTLDQLPGGLDNATLWAQTLRASLSGVRGVDLTRIASIQLGVRGGEGTAFLLDVTRVSGGLASLSDRFVAAVDAPNVSIPEGDVPGVVTNIVMPIRGSIDHAARVFVEAVPQGSGVQYAVIDVPVGATSVTFPLHYDGDAVYRGDNVFVFFMYAVRNISVGSYLGQVRIIDNEPIPILTVEQAHATGTEATGLTWTFHLSAPAPQFGVILALFIAPNRGVEIDSADVPPETWNAWTFLDPPNPPQTPSFANAQEWVLFPQNDTTVTLTIPFVADGIAEGPENVALAMLDFGGRPLTVTGTVTDS